MKIAVAMILSLAACTPVSQPKALNNGPLVLLPCLVWCTTSIVLDQADDNDGTVSTSVSESVSVGPVKELHPILP